MSINYKEEILGFERALKSNKAILMPQEEDEVLVCKQLQRMHVDKFNRRPIDFDSVKSLFLGNISILGDKTKLYYGQRGPLIKIERTCELKPGYAEIVGFPKKEKIYVTNRQFTDEDFIAVSHEFGHVPTLENPAKDEYFEYFEVLPMYLEYLACLGIDKEKAMDLFLKIRLDSVKRESKFYLDHTRQIKNNNSNSDKMHTLLRRDYYKYIKSLEFVLQLIERANGDQEKVNELLDQVVLGQRAIKDIRKPLDIDTTGCKQLLKIAAKK